MPLVRVSENRWNESDLKSRTWGAIIIRARLRECVEARFGYDLARSVDDIHPTYHFDVSCQGSVPEAIIAFLELTDFEDAIRKAVSLGGDSDTIACVAGAIAGAFYGGVPAPILAATVMYLDDRLRRVVDALTERHMSG